MGRHVAPVACHADHDAFPGHGPDHRCCRQHRRTRSARGGHGTAPGELAARRPCRPLPLAARRRPQGQAPRDHALPGGRKRLHRCRAGAAAALARETGRRDALAHPRRREHAAGVRRRLVGLAQLQGRRRVPAADAPARLARAARPARAAPAGAGPEPARRGPGLLPSGSARHQPRRPVAGLDRRHRRPPHPHAAAAQPEHRQRPARHHRRRARRPGLGRRQPHAVLHPPEPGHAAKRPGLPPPPGHAGQRGHAGARRSRRHAVRGPGHQCITPICADHHRRPRHQRDPRRGRAPAAAAGPRGAGASRPGAPHRRPPGRPLGDPDQRRRAQLQAGAGAAAAA